MKDESVPFVTTTTELWRSSLLVHSPIIRQVPSENGEILYFLSHIRQMFRSERLYTHEGKRNTSRERERVDEM